MDQLSPYLLRSIVTLINKLIISSDHHAVVGYQDRICSQQNIHAIGEK